MVDLPAALDEGMWEMHKLQMVGLRNLPCGGLGPTNQEAATRNPYGREPLDSARDMYREGQESKLSGDLLLDHTPVDEYGVPLLETIAEASKELSAQSSAGTVSSFAAPRPPCTKSKPIHARKSTKPTIRNLETLDEMINEGKADQHRSSRSVKMLEAEMEASCGRNPRDLTGANGRYWTTTDGQKYKDVRKNNWTQTDVDKDMTTIRGIHHTIDSITSGLEGLQSGLDRVKSEVRMGKRDSLDHELRAAHDKYRQQAQWEVDKIYRKLDAQRLAQNSLIENAVMACKRSMQIEAEQRVKETEAPLHKTIEALRFDIKAKDRRIVELENEIDMLKQDRTHIQQKFNNLRVELEMGTYSPLVAKLREELGAEKVQSEYLMKLCRDLELDVVDVKDRQRRARESLEESKELIKSLKAENRQLKRELVHLAAATEQEANQVAAKHSADVERLSTELASSRDDYKRQVKIMDILNSQYQQAMSAHEEEIDELQTAAEAERRRVTAFLKQNNVPSLVRGLSVAASSRRIRSRTGVDDLKEQISKLNDGLEEVIAGIPEAIRMMTPASTKSAGHQRSPLGRPSKANALKSPLSQTGLGGNTPLPQPSHVPVTGMYCDDETPPPMSPRRTLLPLDEPAAATDQSPGPSGPPAEFRRLFPSTADPGDRARNQLHEIRGVVSYIGEYQSDLHKAVAGIAMHRSPRGNKPPLPSPRARVPRLVLHADGPHRGPADYHVHASEHPPPNLLQQCAVEVFRPEHEEAELQQRDSGVGERAAAE